MSARRFGDRGFSLLEILVSTAILGLVLVAIGEAISTMQNTWVRVRAKSDVYRPLRAAADTMNRRVSMATLNARWEVDEKALEQGREQYVKESELHFVSGPALDLVGRGGELVGHGVFFQAPFGVDDDQQAGSDPDRHDRLSHALNAWGYFIEYGSDSGQRPSFMADVGERYPARRRFRLMEYRQPTAELDIFRPEPNGNGKPEISAATSKSAVRRWLEPPLRGGSPQDRHVSVLAENVVALVIRPISGGRLLSASESNREQYDLAPEGEYDTRRFQWDGATVEAVRSRHRLPPALEITLVATNEESWARLIDSQVEMAASRIRGAVNGRFQNPDAYQADLDSLIDTLNKAEIDHRVLRSVVPLAEGRKEFRNP